MTAIDFDLHLKAFNERGNDYRYTFTQEEVNYIKSRLTAGKWINDSDGFYCSECGTYIGYNTGNFCLYCGSDNREYAEKKIVYGSHS